MFAKCERISRSTYADAQNKSIYRLFLQIEYIRRFTKYTMK